MTLHSAILDFPQGWMEKHLGDDDIAEIVSGGTPSTLINEYWGGDIHWATPTDITSTKSKYLSTTERTITHAGLTSCGARMLPPGSLLLCSRATVGEIRISTVPICTNQGFKSIVAKPGVSNEFLYYKLLTMKDDMVQRSYGSTFLELSTKEARSLPLMLPKFEEQNLIAEALMNIDSLIEALEKLIAKKRAMKLGTMQQLLNGKTRITGFHENWTSISIGDVAECVSGGTPSTLKNEYWNNGIIPWMSSGELHARRIRSVKGRITELGLDESSAQLVPIGSVLIGLAGQGKTRGTVAISEIELCTNQSIAAVLPNSTLNSDYLFHNLVSRYDELRTLSTGDGGRGGLNLTIIRGLEVPLPTVEEQQAIAKVLNDMDAEIDVLVARRDKTVLIKTGMMQELLTGRTRLL